MQESAMYGPEAVNILWNNGLRKVAERVCRELDIGTKKDIAALTDEQIQALNIWDWQKEVLKLIRSDLFKSFLHSKATEKVEEWRDKVRPPRVPAEKRTKLKDKVRREAVHLTLRERKERHDKYEAWVDDLHGLRSLLAQLQSGLSER